MQQLTLLDKLILHLYLQYDVSLLPLSTQNIQQMIRSSKVQNSKPRVSLHPNRKPFKTTLIIIDKQRFISNVLETSQFLRKIKQQTSFLLKN